MTKAKKYLVPLLTVLSAPVAVMIIILLAYKQDGAYPFGEGTVAWCDMVQQVVPLLIDFKDILAGKDGVFLNFHNAAGMNMWAVIFFFMASPFSFLAAFVEKTDMLHFANILVMLKLFTFRRFFNYECLLQPQRLLWLQRQQEQIHSLRE